jgi:IS30 family transposase
LLYELSQEGNLSQQQMAVLLGCHQSTISRELRRNQSSLGCYLPDTAQAKSETRPKNAKQPWLFVTLYAKSTDKMPRQHTSNPKIPKVSQAIASPFY